MSKFYFYHPHDHYNHLYNYLEYSLDYKAHRYAHNTFGHGKPTRHLYAMTIHNIDHYLESIYLNAYFEGMKRWENFLYPLRIKSLEGLEKIARIIANNNMNDRRKQII